MPVAQIPRRGAAAKHRAIILLRVFDQPRVLLCKKEFVGGNFPVATEKFRRLISQLNQLLHHFVFTRFDRTHCCGVAVFLRIAAQMIEARITATRAFRRVRIHFLEVIENRVDRGMQAIQIHAEKSGWRFLWIDMLIKAAQPFHKFYCNGIAPHPRGEPPKSQQRFLCIAILVCAARIAIDAICVWPIGFYGNHREAFFRDQPFGDCRALEIKLVCPVRSFSEQNKSRVAD